MSLITTNVECAVSDLLAEKPVAIPTETVYGLAAIISSEKAIKAVFAMKQRPLNHPLIVHVAPDWPINELVENIPDYAYQLINEFWPGPLTLILPVKTGQINPLITGGQTSVALRCPAHPMAQKLLEQLNIPVVAPSANPFGKISPTTALHVQQAFNEEQLIILDGGRCTVGIESTIIDATDPVHYKILRHGLINENSIALVISANHSKEDSLIRAPGKLESHYQPQKTLYYFDQFDSLSRFCEVYKDKVFVLANTRPESIQNEYFYPLAITPEQVAFDLYYQLRKADSSNGDCIAIQLPPETTEWQGIRERILKAGMPYL